MEEKITLNLFLQCPFTNRQQLRVFIQERNNCDMSQEYHFFYGIRFAI
jgi:hypothetical protein